jgi:transcriptional antiterminator RfaH
MLRWYLIHTKPLGEATARLNLERQGYETYVPRLAETTVRGGKVRDRVVALFPRYLFLHLNEGEQALAPVRSSTGVASVVRFGMRYAIVPDRIVNELRVREDNSGLHRLSKRPLMPGTEVSIRLGPFAGLEGVFEREAGTDRVLVLLQLLGQDVRVGIPAQSIVPGRAA